MTFGRIGNAPASFSDEQRVLYNEMMRARRYKRPLTVLAIKIDEKTIQRALPKMLEEIQQAMMSEYVWAGMTRILDESLLDFDTIVRREDHFLILLPETEEKDIPSVTRRIKQAIEAELDVTFSLGTANYPADAPTFESIVEMAIQKADQQLNPDPKTSTNSQP